MALDAPSGERQQQLLSQFMDIVSGQSLDSLRPYLEATNWQLDDAIQLFFAGAGEAPVPQPAPAPTTETSVDIPDDYVRPPLPVVREALYDDTLRAAQLMSHGQAAPPLVDAFRNFEDEFKPASASGSSAATLASLYRPPHDLIFCGSFEQAKAQASRQGKWLLMNIQSHTEFASHMLNRDTWAHEAVKETVGTSFIFWQVYDESEEGSKVCTYYRLVKMPAVLLIDPITGQKMKVWDGMVGPERLLEELLPFMDSGPKDNVQPRHSAKASEEEDDLKRALAASLEGPPPPRDDKLKQPQQQQQATAISYPTLSSEPKPGTRDVCRVGVRFPDGRRVQRHFLSSDPVTHVWSFCASQLEGASSRKFRLLPSIPGAKPLGYDPASSLTIRDAGFANAMLVVAWE